MLLNARRIRRDGQEMDNILLGIEDITERRQTEARIATGLREKEVLSREIYHRVENNLHIVSSLLSFQAAAIADEAVRSLFLESQRRIQAMSLVHQRLYSANDLTSIDTHTYLQSFLSDLAGAYDPDSRIALDIQAEGEMNLDTAIPCGLLLTELVSNAYKYAFPAGRAGWIRVTLRPGAEERWLLVVEDNGIGLPRDVDITPTNSLGLTLVHHLSSQLAGSVQLDRTQGTRFTIHFRSAPQGET
jgi:two-component sensor histidine kinase